MLGARHKNQESKIIEALVRAGDWVSAVELSKVSLQYCARVHAIRKRLGIKIENRVDIGPDGVRRGYYRLARGMPATISHPATPAASDTLFAPGELERCAPPQDAVSRFEAARMARRRTQP
jgi:hypothetical protein